MNFDLPKAVYIGGKALSIRYDFRVILEIITMLNDIELTNADKAEALLTMFYVNPEEIDDVQQAVTECYSFIDQGSKQKKKQPRLIDWEQDFDYIVAPVNRVLGYEIRSVDYDAETNTGGLHWWTFLSAYMEIGSECLLSQIVSMRDKLARNKKLEKYEREWLRHNRHLVDLPQKYTADEDELIKKWI